MNAKTERMSATSEARQAAAHDLLWEAKRLHLAGQLQPELVDLARTLAEREEEASRALTAYLDQYRGVEG